MRYVNQKDIYIVAHYLGKIMQGVGISVLIPLLVALIYKEYSNFLGFIIPAFISIGIGTVLTKINIDKGRIRLKHGMMISSLAWLWAAFVGSLIMIICLDVSFLDAFFENMSAWTSSGFTMFPDVEALPKSILFLRSLEQWIGGLGVVVMIISIFIHSGKAAARLYKSEAREERIKPSVGNTLKKILQIYVVYTIIGIALFIIAGMPIFDSINNTFTTIATGGMSIKNANMGFYNNNTFYLISMFLMILGATSFLTHYRAFKTKGLAIFQDLQFRIMIFLIIVSSVIIYLATTSMPMNIVYHTISAITTTGANIDSTNNITIMGSVMEVILLLLMLIGGSAGSTVGAIKLSRVIIFLRSVSKNITNIISPEGRVVNVKIADKKIKEREIAETSSYISLYFLFIAIGWIALVLYGYDGLDSLFEVVSMQGNVGLSSGIIDETLPMGAKIVMIFNMWIGRLEIIPVLVILRSILEIFKVKTSRKAY
ncbi:Trk system potassium uptake protein TrkG [Methanobrevibacter cuticularis]|uniref:Trk system potassium uptake protein TrkG n=2 Tax=Methanobrevibacter cuticularis TaxID=47311 RepID=A0A166EJX5_9EURY|nr:Trk system potassium uptake protein TrkG [Methanobrevibacter cuticularis]